LLQQAGADAVFSHLTDVLCYLKPSAIPPK
jgi:hypothetical protein